MLTRKILHDSFEVGILVKAFDGVVQVIAAILISFWPAIFSHYYSLSTVRFTVFYLATHGIIKIFIVYCLWQKKLWAYPIAIIVFGLFGMYQVYRYNLTHAVGLIILTILDVAIIALTWIEYRRLRQI